MRKIARVFFKDISTLNKVILTFQELQEGAQSQKEVIVQNKTPYQVYGFSRQEIPNE